MLGVLEGDRCMEDGKKAPAMRGSKIRAKKSVRECCKVKADGQGTSR